MASLTEKMRENSPAPYVTNPMTPKSSPEKALVKGYHKRMNSMQSTTDTRSEFRNYLETRPPERPLRASIYEPADKQADKTPSKSPGTSNVHDSDSPSRYSSSRYLSKPILGESTPPSSTMLALQNMQVPEESESKKSTNSGQSSSNDSRFEALSEQILSLTSIATNLQKEMAQLSRRSKDNASDLLSLKAATNARDEDIRRSIRELASNISSKFLDPDIASTRSAPYTSASPQYSGDNRTYENSPPARKSYMLPRMASPGAYYDREYGPAPAPISDGSASIALLEKVLREMATKEAQEKLLELVDEVKRRPAKEGGSKEADQNITKMLEEIINLVKEKQEKPQSGALVRSDGTSNGDALSSTGQQAGPLVATHAADFQKRISNDEILDLLQRIKNSVAEGGGLTNEVKALVRELRGEVLGMGRDLARKLEEVESSQREDVTSRESRAAEVSAIVQKGLEELRENMQQMIEKHQEDIAKSVSRPAVVDSNEVYAAVKTALEESTPQPSQPAPEAVSMIKEDILKAVKEAWETYKPEIELQNFGLERDEILECLSEGLKEYKPKSEDSVTYDQVLAAVQAGMQTFVPPPIEPPPSVTREDIMSAVKECLESFELTLPEPNLTKEDVFAAVAEALAEKQSNQEPNPGITRDDLVNAVSDGFAAHQAAEREIERPSATREDVINVVNEALVSHLAELKESSATRDDVIQVINDALASHVVELKDSSASRDDVIQVINDALASHLAELKESNTPRDDVIQCINEALASHLVEVKDSSVTRDDIIQVINEALASHLVEVKDSSVTRDDILQVINDALASHLGELKESETKLTREDMVNAISEALEAHQAAISENGLNKNDLCEAVEAGLRAALEAEDGQRGDQVRQQVQDAVQGLKEELQQISAMNSHDTEHVVEALKENLEVLRNDIVSYVDRASDITGKDEIIDTVKQGLSLLQADLERTVNEAAATTAAAVSTRNPNTPELLDAMEKEFEHLRSTLSSLLIRNSVSSDKDEILDAIRDLSESNDKHRDTTAEVARNLKEEFENIKETLCMSMVKSGSSDKDEIIAALRAGFETLQSESAKSREESTTGTGELLVAFNDGIDSIRADLEKIIEKPSENGNAEVLETLKDGLAMLKVEMDSLREAQKQFEEASETRGKEIMLSSERTLANDIDSLKVLITQLQIKIEAMEAMVQNAQVPEDTLRKQDMDEVLVAVRDVQSSVTEAVAREVSANSEAAKKDDIDMIDMRIEELKTKIDGLVLPSPDEVAKEEHLTALEAIVSELKDTVAETTARLEANGATKNEIGTLETLLKDIWVTIDDLKTAQQQKNEPETDESDESAPVRKRDLQTVEAMIFEVKTQIDELKIPDPNALPSKEDVEALGGLVAAFKEKVDADAELTAQAFEARKVEHGGLADKIEEAKVVVADLRDELMSKLDGSQEGLQELKTLFEGLAVASESFGTVESIKELNELINREFERARGEHEAVKVEMEERNTAALVKQDENRAAIIEDLGAKIEEKTAAVLSKYDEMQAMLESKFSEAEARDAANVENLTSTKNLAEDIKLVIGAMGDSVNETCERMCDDARTFFNKVDESYNKMESLHTELKDAQEQSKAELEKTSATTSRVETQLSEYQPQILNAIKDVLAIVSQHFEHSQKSAEELKTDLSAIPNVIPQMLPALPPPEPREIIVPEKYDDTEIQNKLDVIVAHAEDTRKNMASMDKLDEIHEKVMATSREITEMVAKQSQLVVEDYERKKREAEEAAYALERRLAQKEKIEEEILNLNEEKESLLKVIQTLKREKEELVKQNTKLSKELSGLETALEIRQEELQVMEDRAETLERRILEGVLDHARSVLLSRPGSNSQLMNLKRVPSSASTATRTSRVSTTSTAKDARSLASSGVGMALKRQHAIRRNHPGSQSSASSVSSKERRILSLSHVTGNKGSGASVKRSHSVRSNMPSRKVSWGAGDAAANKENEAFPEPDDHSDSASETETERRTSFTGTYAESAVSMNRQPSYTSSVNGGALEQPESILEEEEGEEERRSSGDDDHESYKSADEHRTAPESPVVDTEIKPHTQADSGIGTELASNVA